MRTLDGVSTRSFAVSGVDLLHGSNVLDLLDEESFLGRLWMFFSWGDGGGEEELQGACS
jgi:hypothetical protein